MLEDAELENEKKFFQIISNAKIQASGAQVKAFLPHPGFDGTNSALLPRPQAPPTW